MAFIIRGSSNECVLEVTLHLIEAKIIDANLKFVWHRFYHVRVSTAEAFYVMYAALVAGAATIVLIPGSPLGLFTEGVQVLAGVLLPSATVFLLMLCNDKAVLGPWVNGRVTNAFTGAVIALLITLSLILVASVVFPGLGARQIITIMLACAGVAVAAGIALLARRRPAEPEPAADRVAAVSKEDWRMPRLAMLAPAPMSAARRLGMAGMWVYLAIAMSAVVVRIIELALGR